MAKKTPIEKLDAAIAQILADYGDQVSTNMDEITVKVGKAGLTALKQESKQTFKQHTGHYAKGWKMETVKSRLNTSVVLHNEHSGLPHLLEKGHAKRGGGRVEGRAHIELVEQSIIEQFESEVEVKL